MKKINMYCDESSHLNYKDENVMGFACVTCDISKLKEINNNIREIKSNFKIPIRQELKWSKISPSNVYLYKSILNNFFVDDDISFRCLIIKNKNKLTFTRKNNPFDFYYKMMYTMIIKILNPVNEYNIYLDIKDTNSAKRIKSLESYLNNTKLDFNLRNTVLKVQTIRSYESNLLQLADILLGALIYTHKGEFKSKAKNEIVEYIKYKSNKQLLKSTLISEQKFNIFIADAKKMRLRGEDEYL